MTTCKYFQAPPLKKNGVYVFTDKDGNECVAGPWKDIKGWCRYIAPAKRYSEYVPCIHSNDNKVECPLKEGWI